MCRLIAVAAIALLVGALSPRFASPAAADTTGVLLVACEHIVPGIDGDLQDQTIFSEYQPVCGGTQISEQEISNLDDAYGDNDGQLELEDLSAQAALDDEQIQASCTAAAAGCTLLVFTFVADEDPVTLDIGPDVKSLQNGGVDFVCDTEGQSFTADKDCSQNNPTNGDGVVVFHFLNSALVPGDTSLIRVIQGGVAHSATAKIMGPPASQTLTFSKTRLQVSGPTASDALACEAETDLYDPAAPGRPNVVIVRMLPRDAGGRELTRVGATITSDQTTRAFFTEPPLETGVTATTGISVKLASGIGQYAVICGGTERGAANVISDINLPGPDLILSAPLLVLGEPASIALNAAPPSILCDGVAITTITATVRDVDGALVADGTPVHFGISVLGVVNPINRVTSNGVATTVARGTSAYTQGMPVNVAAMHTGDDLQRTILITCTGFDTDGDGMPNAFEAGKACLNSIASDSHVDQDLDGLASLMEYQLSTNPCVPDTDTDGCGDGAEVGADRFLGGDRNPLDVWDFYDVTADRLIDLSDALVILAAFGVGVNDVGYVAAYDRYAPNPAKPWRTAHAIDGAGIDLTDALVNLDSFGDDCTNG